MGKWGLFYEQSRGEDGNAGLLLVAFSVILVRLGGAQQYIGIRPAEGLQPLGHQPCKGDGTGVAQVGVVGLALRVVRVESGSKYHVQFAAGRLAELLHQLGAGGSQVNERQRLPRSKLTDCIGVGAVGRRQAVTLKMTAHQRRDKHRQRTLGLCFARVGQQIGSILLRRSVAGRILRLFIVVAELDQQQVTRAQCSLDRCPKALLTETFGAAAIAGVIAMEPKCIVLDEPTAMLDPRGRREVIDTIGRLNREKGITVVLITHHMDEAAKAQRVVVLDKGKVAADGTPKEVFSQVELLHDIGLAAPETVELCWKLNQEGYDLPLDKQDPKECAQALYNFVMA